MNANQKLNILHEKIQTIAGLVHVLVSECIGHYYIISNKLFSQSSYYCEEIFFFNKLLISSFPVIYITNLVIIKWKMIYVYHVLISFTQVNQDTGKWAHRLIAIKAIWEKLKNNSKIYIIKHSYTTKKKKVYKSKYWSH